MAKPDLHVSIAILIHQNRILVGWRKADQHQGNKYEFPGGKVEVGETPRDACVREVFEEVGVQLKQLIALNCIAHEYEDIIVHLHFFLSYLHAADLDVIQAPWAWYRRDELVDLNFPTANKRMIKRLSWPKQIKISEDIRALNQLNAGQYFYWRPATEIKYAQLLADYSPEQLSCLIVNIDVWKQLSELQQNMVAAIQIKHDQLMQLKLGDLSRDIPAIASCHDQISLSYAQQIGCEAAFLSPVLATESHPDSKGLGWSGFAQLAQQADLAVYALGGVKAEDLHVALQHYAHGIAGIRHL
ncbi:MULTISPECIES: NUDIX domain-containing protein [unclassified Acinetobacter]|uniref:NUDIX domain-containing protein n=1 Tax=unclassified Acinetobacter TaxID=196816 RepID=UPI002934C209|nr:MULTISPECIES: NUDIX domain-containing protein [unclassified Acinetobacter]WOE32376.1 NUDIX domain-containing protein [Acinetobacter sp. SAAs470]WOE37849.1 NUDIX domain-containing protein [Acinetobacter sp. SAAs474]